jgi:predicted MFS family arabinose efflux permease
MAVAQLVGPSLAAAILGLATGTRGESLVFAVAAMAVGSAAAIGLLFPRGPARGASSTPEPSGPAPGLARSTGAILRRPGMPAAMFVSIVVISTVDVLAAYLPVYGEAAGLSVAVVGGLLSIRAGATLVSRLFMVWLIARLGRRLLLAVSLAVSALGLGLVPFTASPVGLAILMILGGFALGMGQPMTIAWVANRATRQDRATALAVRLTGNRAALLIVPAAMGVVAGAAGVAAIFWAIAALLGTGAAVAYATPDDESDADGRPVATLPERG